MELFPLVSCILQENYVQSGAFPAFVVHLLQARKLNQQPAMAYDMGNSEELVDYKGP